MKIALFGGSFDPFHTDHLKMVKLAKKTLQVNEVWIIPTNQNPFKDRKLSSAYHRIEMIKLATKDLDYVKILDIEVNKSKPSTTFDTVSYLKSQYQNYQFYFLIGSDQLKSLDKWDNIDKLIDIQTFVIFKRDIEFDQVTLQKYKAIGIEFEENSYLSSTIIRDGLHLEKEIPEIIDYINMNLLYLEERIESKMDQKRYIHCLNTGQTAYELAKLHNLDPDLARVAGTYHDITKRWSEEMHRKYLSQYLPEYLYEPVPTWHSYTGYLHMKHDLLFKNQDILNAVKWHTVGHPEMTLFEMLIFVADKVSFERDYPNVKYYRELAQQDLRQAFLELLKNQYATAKDKHGEHDLGKLINDSYQYYFQKGE